MDLIEKLNAALDETERIARAVLAKESDEYCWDPPRELRLAAAHRKTLARHQPQSIRLPGETQSRLRCFSCRADGPFLSDADVSVGGAARARYDRLSIPAPWPCDDILDLAEACGIGT